MEVQGSPDVVSKEGQADGHVGSFTSGEGMKMKYQYMKDAGSSSSDSCVAKLCVRRMMVGETFNRRWIEHEGIGWSSYGYGQLWATTLTG